MESFDYIVIGGGSAGSAVAGRLAVDGTRRYRIDLAFPDLMIAVEVDGSQHEERPATLRMRSATPRWRRWAGPSSASGRARSRSIWCG